MLVLSADGQHKLRLVANRASADIANQRRRKFKKDSRKTLSKELSELMSWSIFVTTMTAEAIDFQMLESLYAFRWRIENIFKIWKSNLNFSKIHNVSSNQLHILICARLIMIVLLFDKLYSPIAKAYNKKN